MKRTVASVEDMFFSLQKKNPKKISSFGCGKFYRFGSMTKEQPFMQFC